MTRTFSPSIDAFASARLEDRSTAIRQLVDQALRDLTKREALQAYQGGRMTLREFARALRLDPWAAQDVLAAEGSRWHRVGGGRSPRRWPSSWVADPQP